MNAAAASADAVDLHAAFMAMQAASRRDIDVSAATRKDRLNRLLRLVQEELEGFAEAISADFGHRSPHETRLAEAFILEAGVKHALRHVDRWMRPRAVATEWQFLPGRSRLVMQPLGTVGVVAPWNYPLQLTLGPALGALAAGNRVLIKPSELAPRFSARLRQAVAARFAADEVRVIEGGGDVSQAFVALPFDHLVFTGSTRVGRMVAEAAGRNLTPVTLELGGKSPAIVDRSADLASAAARIAVGKLLNAGQTCIAPDYVLCPRGTEQAFAEHFLAAARRLYGDDPANPDYTAIVNDGHHRRLRGLLDDAAAKGARILGGRERAEDWQARRKLPPHVALDTTEDMLLRREEIFGPILPVIGCDDADAAVAFVNAGERPLALYWFGDDPKARERVLHGTVSGGVTVNECLLHIAQENLPFGGVGASGMGAYHGEWSFRAFSKAKGVFQRGPFNGAALLNPPYGRRFERILGLLRRFT